MCLCSFYLMTRHLFLTYSFTKATALESKHVTLLLPLVTFSKPISQLCMCQLFLHRRSELLYAKYRIELFEMC